MKKAAYVASAEEAPELDGLHIGRETMRALLSVDPAHYAAELDDTKQFFEKFGAKLPAELRAEHAKLGERLSRVLVAQK